MWSRFLFLAVFVCGLSTHVCGQVQNDLQFGQPPVQVQPVDIRGTLANVGRSGIEVVGVDGKGWQVLVPPTAKLQVLGAASADYLKTGMVIEFKGEIDAQGALTDKIDALTIVSPDTLVGLFPPDSSREDEELDAGADDEGGKRAKRGKAATKGIAAGSYRIVGKLSTGRGGKLSVQVERVTLPLELAEQPTIEVDVNDISLAAQGDKVSVTGIMMPAAPGRSRTNAPPVGRAQAAKVKVELSEPLGDATARKKAAAKTDGKKPAKRPKKAEPAGTNNW